MTDATKIEAPIQSVTILEDRGRVVRRGTVTVATTGRVQLLLEPVAPVLVDKSLAVRVADGGTASVQVADARPERALIPEVEDGEEPDSVRSKLVLELRERRETAEKMSAEAQLLDAEADGLGRLSSWTLSELADDVSRGRGLDSAAFADLEAVREKERARRAEAARAWHEVAEYNRASDRLEKRIEELETPSTKRWCGVRIDLDVARPGDVRLELEYVVPAAMWRPAHVATLLQSDDGTQVAEIATRACVWQRTGEDWNDVELCFSTERASLGAEPPLLHTDVLRVRKRQEQLVVETREQEVQHLSGRGDDVTVAREMPGIDDGGQVVSLRTREPVSVPCDGRAHRLDLATFEAPVEVKLWTYPELSNAVVYQTVLVNRGTTPVLAGPVELVREGGWVGRTSVGFVAQGEEFELSWGPESSLRARRELVHAKEESRALSSWTSREESVTVRLSNFGRDARVVNVRERVPVSEIEKVKVEISAKDITDGQLPDENGFVTWSVELGPRATKKLLLTYTLKRHSDVVGV